LVALLRRLAREEERRVGLPVKVHVCFEAATATGAIGR